jgi:hypothetical protein
LLVFWIDQRRHGRFLENSAHCCRRLATTSISGHRFITCWIACDVMIMSPEFMKYLCGVTSTLSASLSHRIGTITNPMPQDIRLPCICVNVRALRQPVFYQERQLPSTAPPSTLANRTSLP